MSVSERQTSSQITCAKVAKSWCRLGSIAPPPPPHLSYPPRADASFFLSSSVNSAYILPTIMSPSVHRSDTNIPCRTAPAPSPAVSKDSTCGVPTNLAITTPGPSDPAGTNPQLPGPHGVDSAPPGSNTNGVTPPHDQFGFVASLDASSSFRASSTPCPGFSDLLCAHAFEPTPDPPASPP